MGLQEIPLGHGHWLRWASWSPDRDLNPQYAGLPDIEHCTAIIRHPLRDDDSHVMCGQRGYCEGAATIDGPVTRQLFSEQGLWRMESSDPLTLSPSLLCHCGDHGFIREGRWQPA